MARTWDRMVPFDGKGNLMDWTSAQPPDSPDHQWSATERRSVPCGEWRESQPFDAEVTFDGWVRGRSAAHAAVKVKPLNGLPPFGATIFLTDFADVLTNGTIEEGRVTGTGPWEFCKRGQNFGLRLVEAK